MYSNNTVKNVLRTKHRLLCCGHGCAVVGKPPNYPAASCLLQISSLSRHTHIISHSYIQAKPQAHTQVEEEGDLCQVFCKM